MSRGTQVPIRAPHSFAYRTFTFFDRPSQTVRLPAESRGFKPDRSYTPHVQARRFGLLPVRSPLLGESLLISLPPGTKMFQFPGFASHTLQHGMTLYYQGRVPPFGNPRFKGCLLLTEAYRS